MALKLTLKFKRANNLLVGHFPCSCFVVCFHTSWYHIVTQAETSSSKTQQLYQWVSGALPHVLPVWLAKKMFQDVHGNKEPLELKCKLCRYIDRRHDLVQNPIQKKIQVTT